MQLAVSEHHETGGRKSAQNCLGGINPEERLLDLGKAESGSNNQSLRVEAVRRAKQRALIRVVRRHNLVGVEAIVHHMGFRAVLKTEPLDIVFNAGAGAAHKGDFWSLQQGPVAGAHPVRARHAQLGGPHVVRVQDDSGHAGKDRGQTRVNIQRLERAVHHRGPVAPELLQDGAHTLRVDAAEPCKRRFNRTVFVGNDHLAA